MIISSVLVLVTTISLTARVIPKNEREYLDRVATATALPATCKDMRA